MEIGKERKKVQIILVSGYKNKLIRIKHRYTWRSPSIFKRLSYHITIVPYRKSFKR